MQKFFIPLLGIIYKRLQKGFTARQKLWAVLLGIAILVNFMFRAACPPERRFFTSPSSSTMYVCATPDVAKYSLPLGSSRSAQSHGIKGPAPL
jgi:hypothetical protein